MPKKNNESDIVLGGGCFWCTEAAFTQLKGVLSATPGYAGGTTKDPTYYQVATGRTGHAETVRVVFDPSVISLTDILDLFFVIHDPTSLNKQGADVGTEYRSIILTTSPEQQADVYAYLTQQEKSGHFSKPIVTEVAPLTEFYPAEISQQEYYRRNPNAAYCQLVIYPKLSKLRAKFASLLK